MSKATKPKFLPHVHLEKLIKERFKVQLSISHFNSNFKFPFQVSFKVKACTRVIAKKNDEHIAMAYAYCSEKDQFVRSKGLTTALRRLYRNLVELEKKPAIQD